MCTPYLERMLPELAKHARAMYAGDVKYAERQSSPAAHATSMGGQTRPSETSSLVFAGSKQSGAVRGWVWAARFRARRLFISEQQGAQGLPGSSFRCPKRLVSWMTWMTLISYTCPLGPRKCDQVLPSSARCTGPMNLIPFASISARAASTFSTRKPATGQVIKVCS